MTVDYLVVGSGLTGATVARLLADARREVLVLERRSHVGGNVHDRVHFSGIVIHSYGPHYFRTTSEQIWEYVSRFASFHRYEAQLLTDIEGTLEHWPVTTEYMRRTVGHDWRPCFAGAPSNFEEACLAMMPALVYEKFVRGYTEKQWGAPAGSLSATLARRLEVRANGDYRLVRHRYQGIPRSGYSAFMSAMLRGIPVWLGTDYADSRDRVQARRALVYTGSIDELFGYCLGRLQYRGQRRIHEYLPSVGFAQQCGQINNPDPLRGAHIRSLEWKHLMPREEWSRVRGTVVTREIPFSSVDVDQREYPFPSDANAALYQRYGELAKARAGLVVCGRLGEYRYYDMDQAIARAMQVAATLVGDSRGARH